MFIFSAIFEVLASTLRWWVHTMADLRMLIVNTANKFWLLVVLIAGFVYIALHDLYLMVTSIVTLVSALSGSGIHPGTNPSFFSEWLKVANTFAPLDECVGYFIIYAHIAVAFGVYKLVKSWLPAAAGFSIGQGSGS